MAVFTLTPGVDNLTGNAGQDNTFQVTASTLQSTDIVTGGATGSFIDTLSLTAAGTITAAQFAGVTNIEQLTLANGTNSVTLTNGLVAGTSLAGRAFVVAGGTGDDTVDGSAINNGVHLLLSSLGGADTLKGGTGNDTLDGGSGADAMTGGAGNDTYFVDDVGDTVIESAGAGIDTVYASINYVLPANVEQLYLQGSGSIAGVGNGEQNLIVGNASDNALDGGANNDTLMGGGGNDTLFGGTGVDGMIGGTGNDTYFVDNVGDVVVENASEGIDTVYTASNYVLGANVEQLFLQEGGGSTTGVGNDGQNLLVGNSFDNALDGGANNDTLMGGGGNDTLDGGTGVDGMIGGTGNDTYFLDNVGDVIVENAGEGIDTVYTASNYMLGANVEQLYLLELGGAITGVGNGEQNLLVGNSFANALDGGANSDTLRGGDGNDTLYGGTGGGPDAMFGEGDDDTILIEDSTFAGIDGGAGLDRITLLTPSQNFDLHANVAKISNIEIISLTESSGATLSLFNTDIPIINASGNSLYVLGGSDDAVTANDTWTIVTTTHTNPAVSADTFIHYHNNSTNSDLYIVDTIPTNISTTATNSAPSLFLEGAPDGNVLPDGIDHTAGYTTGNAGGVAISDTDATVDDPDAADALDVSSHITQLTATLTDAQSGALEYLILTDDGHTIATNNGLAITGENTGTLTVTGSATDTVYQDLLREIRYVNTDTSVGLNTADRHVTVQVQDGVGANSNVATATIAIEHGNHDPVITSDGGGDTASVSINEGTTAVTTVTATDADPGTSLSYSITGGDDGGLFSIDGGGNLTFASTPNFETPGDLNGDNIYLVQVEVSDGNSFDTQLISVTVDDLVPQQPIDADAAANTVSNSADGLPAHVTAVSADVAGGPVTYSITNDTSLGGFAINSDTGVVTVADHTKIATGGSYTITVKANDGTFDSPTQTRSTCPRCSMRPLLRANRFPTSSEACNLARASSCRSISTAAATASSTWRR